uniref:Calponin-homology (CH) domain-containing protein n=1 Tax=Macrostomum lignano TaxID=282301 RepID=A0A1I8IWV5_9PLAT
PDLIDPERTSRLSNAERLRLAFDINERHLGVARLLEPEDVDTPHADDLSLITYLSALYDALADRPIGRSQAGDERDGDAEEEANKREELAYREAASELSAWLQRAAKEAAAAGDPPTGLTQARVNAEAAQALLTEISERTSVQLQDLRQRYDRLSQAASAAVPQHQRRRQQQLEAGAHPDQLGRQAERCLALARDRCRSAQLHRQRLERLHRLAEAARTDIGALEARLADLGDSERHLRASLSSAAASASSSLDAMDAESAMDRLARGVSKAGEAVNRLFERIQRLRDERYGRAEQLYHSLCTAHLAYLELHRLVDSLAPRIRLLQQQHRGQQHRRLERQHYRDVTSVSRAFSDSPAFSPIRRCMGRVRERREQLDRAEAATMAAAAAAAAAQEDIAGLDELRPGVLPIANDTVAEAAACGAIGDGLPESDRATYAALLTELEAACTDLTGAAQRRLRHLEAWLAFAESAASLLAWLDERETRVLRLQRRQLRLAEVADVEAYLKSTVSELEDREAKFAAALPVAAPLPARQPPRTPAEACLRRLEERWAAHLSLAGCLQHQTEAAAAAAAHSAGARRVRASLADITRRLGTEFLDQRPGQSAESTASRLRAVDGLREQLDRAAGEANWLAASAPHQALLAPAVFDGNPGSLSGQLLCQWSSLPTNLTVALHRIDGPMCLVSPSSSAVTSSTASTTATTTCWLPAVCLRTPWSAAVSAARSLQTEAASAAALWRRRRLALRRRHLLSRLAGLRSGSRSSSTLATSAEQRRAALAAVEREVEQQLTDEATESINDDEASKKLRAELELCRRSCQSSLAGSQAEDSADTRNAQPQRRRGRTGDSPDGCRGPRFHPSSEQLSSPPLLPQQPRQPLRQPTPQSPDVGAICHHRWSRACALCAPAPVIRRAYQQLVQDCAVWLAGCRQKLRNLQSAGRPAAHSSLEPLCRSFERALALRQSLRSARPDIDALNTAGGALASAAQRYEAVDGGGGGSGGNAQQLAEELARVNADYAACVAGAEAAIASLRTGILQPAGLDPAASAVKEASEQQQQLQTVDSADPDDSGLVRARTRGHFGGADSASVRLGLSRLLDSGLARPGGVLDPCSGRLLTFAQAAAGAGSLLDTGVKEVVASSDAGKMTLAEACSAGVVDLATGKMRDFNTGDWLDFPEARRRGLLLPPLTPGEALSSGLLQSGNGENDGADLPRLLSDGVIDGEQKALVLDCASSTGGGIERKSVSLSEALQRGLLTADCRLQCQPEPQPLTVALAESRVLLHSEEVAVPFPDAVAVSATAVRLPLATAVQRGQVDLAAGRFCGLPLATAVQRGLVSEQAAAALTPAPGCGGTNSRTAPS